MEEDWLQWFISFFDKKPKVNGVKPISNQQLANELHKIIIRTFFKKKPYSFFKDNNWYAGLELIWK